MTRPVPSGERQRDVAARVLHLAGRERDVVPGVGGEERADLRDADGDEQAERAVGGGDGRQQDKSGLMAVTPRGVQRSPKLAVIGVGVPAEQQADEDQRDAARAVLAVVKTFWMMLAVLAGRACWSTSAARSAGSPTSCCVESESA